MKNNKFYAFTLAEVLITLAIIGVVAALTIPTVVRNYTEKQTVVQVKKAYSQLNSAFQMATVNSGGADTWNWGTYGVGADADHIVQTYFVPYLKILKNCGTEQGCWANITTKSLAGLNSANYATATVGSRLLLADGTSFYLYTYGNPGCNRSYSIQDIKPLNRVCASIAIDINGEKGPAQLGRDVFLFYLTKYGVYPLGTGDCSVYADLNIYCNIGSDEPASGYGCTAWVLQHENLDYLRKTFACTGGGEVGSGTPWNCSLAD